MTLQEPSLLCSSLWKVPLSSAPASRWHFNALLPMKSWVGTWHKGRDCAHAVIAIALPVVSMTSCMALWRLLQKGLVSTCWSWNELSYYLMYRTRIPNDNTSIGGLLLIHSSSQVFEEWIASFQASKRWRWERVKSLSRVCAVIRHLSRRHERMYVSEGGIIGSFSAKKCAFMLLTFIYFTNESWWSELLELNSIWGLIERLNRTDDSERTIFSITTDLIHTVHTALLTYPNPSDIDWKIHYCVVR